MIPVIPLVRCFLKSSSGVLFDFNFLCGFSCFKVLRGNIVISLVCIGHRYCGHEPSSWPFYHPRVHNPWFQCQVTHNLPSTWKGRLSINHLPLLVYIIMFDVFTLNRGYSVFFRFCFVSNLLFLVTNSLYHWLGFTMCQWEYGRRRKTRIPSKNIVL